MTTPQIEIVRVDFSNARHRTDLPQLINAYAQDPMGNAQPLPPDVLARLPDELGARPHACSVLAYVDDEPAGFVNAFEGFSTFAARPLLNVHDVMVLSKFRGLGLSQRLLSEMAAIARERGCCKLTLEVLSGNAVAKAAYRRFGFSNYQLDPSAGIAEFWQMSL
jgi:ribosomal protein S18 acetylase RimI-like enzyme